MRIHKHSLRSFLFEQQVALYEEIEELRQIQINEGLEIQEEQKLVVAENKLALIKQINKICEERKRY